MRFRDMTARTFMIKSLSTGGVTGFGVVCEDARYASMRPIGSARLVRRWASPTVWKAILQEFALGLEPGPLPSASAVVAVLAERAARHVTVLYLAEVPLDGIDRAETAAALDACLMALESASALGR
jgi:hypothetical protein